MDREKMAKSEEKRNERCGGEWRIIEKNRMTKNITIKKGRKKKEKWQKSKRIGCRNCREGKKSKKRWNRKIEKEKRTQQYEMHMDHCYTEKMKWSNTNAYTSHISLNRKFNMISKQKQEDIILHF